MNGLIIKVLSISIAVVTVVYLIIYKGDTMITKIFSVCIMLSVKLDAPAPCRLDAPDLDLICYASADCLHQHLQVI